MKPPPGQFARPLPNVQAERYAETAGREAYGRQLDRAETRHPCCWERKETGHHPLCPRADS